MILLKLPSLIYRLSLNIVVIIFLFVLFSRAQVLAETTSCTFAVNPTTVDNGGDVAVSISNAIFKDNVITPAAGTFYIRAFNGENGIDAKQDVGITNGTLNTTLRGAFFPDGFTITLRLYHYSGGFLNDDEICRSPTITVTSTAKPNSCASLGYPPNKFTCNRSTGTNWVLGTDGEQCKDDTEIDPICTSTAVTTWLCGANQDSCCLPCRKKCTNIISWGDTCSDAKCCQTGICRHNQCLVDLGTRPFGADCKNNDECGNYNGAALTCQGLTLNDGKCLFPGGSMYCNTNSQCVTRLGDPNARCNSSHQCEGIPKASALPTGLDVDLCRQVNDSLKSKCQSCLDSHGIWTAAGCIPATSSKITEALVKLIVSLAGGFAIILILIGAFIVSTSTSNPERLKSGQQIITSAIIGLVFIILSVTLLHFLGVDLLHIPGLGS